MSENIMLKFKIKLALSIVLKIIVVGAIGIILFLFAIENVFGDFLAETAYSINPELYNMFFRNKSEFILICVILILTICVFYAVFKVGSYLNLIVEKNKEIFVDNDENIVLPKALYEIEIQLNKMKREYSAAKKSAIESEKKKTDLIMYLAHDLKTPLTSVIGYLTLLNDEKNIDDTSRNRYQAIALDKAGHLEDLINEFFEITRFNLSGLALSKENIDLNILLSQLVDEFYPTLEAKKLQCNLITGENLIIKADRDKIARVFENLIRNAISYSPIFTTININANREYDRISVCVENEGKKIEEDKLKYIFEKFYRLDTARTTNNGGAGLGLAIAKEIVTRHDGNIFAVSNDKTTSFTVILPL